MPRVTESPSAPHSRRATSTRRHQAYDKPALNRPCWPRCAALAITRSSNSGGTDWLNTLSSAAETLVEAARQYQAGNHEDAKDLCEKIIAEEPDNADALNFLGLINYQTGAHAAAADWISRALATDPENAAFHYNLGETLRAQEKDEEAIASYYRALSFDPGFVDAYTNLGLLCLSQERLPEAADVLRRAAAYMPTDGAAFARLGAAQEGRGDLEEALATFARAIRFDPGNTVYLQHFAEAVNTYPLPSLPSGLIMELRACFDLDNVAHQTLVPAAMAVLRRDERFAGLLAMTESEDIVAIMAAVAGGIFDELLSEPLLLGMLANTIVTDDELVKVLTTLRRIIMLQGEHQTNPRDFLVGRRRQFVAALALQCFATDYAWFETRREALVAGYMIAEVRRGLDAIDSGSDENAWDLEMWNRLAVVSMYRPLYRIEGIENLLGLGLPTESPYRRMLIQEQLIEPLKERELSARIAPAGRGAQGPTQEEAEAPPYPRWHRLPPIEPTSLAEGLETLIPYFTAPNFAHGPARVLVAGCATGRRALQVALSYENTQVLGTDPSISNLAYAARNAEVMDVGNVDFRHVGRDELGKLEERFQVVDTGETLLWTADALTPWRALTDLLLPSGLMRFQVRVGVGRESLAMAREFVAEKGLEGDAEGVREARRAIIELPDGDPVRRVVTADGFYNFYQCRNLLFPDYEEARFSIGAMREVMADLGLAFLAYEAQKQATTAQFMEEFGDAADPQDLYQWAELESRRPMALSTTHRVWCQKAA